MSVMPSPISEILRSIDESRRRIEAAIAEMHDTIVVSRTHIEITRAWLRDLDGHFPVR